MWPFSKHGILDGDGGLRLSTLFLGDAIFLMLLVTRTENVDVLALAKRLSCK